MANKNVKRYSDILISVGLDEANIPVELLWQSKDDPNVKEPQECKAFLLSLFDSKVKDTLKIDLWTNELQVVEMDRFMFQTLRGFADTYMKATNNHKLANEMQQFVTYFGEQTEIIPKEKN